MFKSALVLRSWYKHLVKRHGYGNTEDAFCPMWKMGTVERRQLYFASRIYFCCYTSALGTYSQLFQAEKAHDTDIKLEANYICCLSAE